MSLLEIKNIKKFFAVSNNFFQKKNDMIRAVDGISFSLEKGHTLGLVGESGCGKTTLARCLVGLYTPDEGQVLIKGKSLKKFSRKQLYRNIQMIFQDPFDSLDPRQTIGQTLAEKYKIQKFNKSSIDKEISKILEKVGLPLDILDKFPHEFSGGQRQRIGIARAVSMNPEIIICDEPVSALDLSVQSKIINLLISLQKKLGLSYVFISHDLSVVSHISDIIAIMYLGKIVEIGNTKNICGTGGFHPYTKALFSAIPKIDTNEKRIILHGEIPSNRSVPGGCRFHPRCSNYIDICSVKEPLLLPRENNPDHFVACHMNF